MKKISLLDLHDEMEASCIDWILIKRDGQPIELLRYDDIRSTIRQHTISIQKEDGSCIDYDEIKNTNIEFVFIGQSVDLDEPAVLIVNKENIDDFIEEV